MSKILKIYNPENNMAWQKEITDNEFNILRSSKRSKVIPVIPATLMPVRTNNLKNFAKDFFLPTLFNHAIKVEQVGRKIFAILASLIWDMLTFPIRLLTCIPRVIVNINSASSLNNVKQYLIQQNVDKKLLASDHVKMRFEWDFYSQIQERTVHCHYECFVNFIELPIYKNHNLYSQEVGQIVLEGARIDLANMQLVMPNGNPIDLHEL